jgi:hypothetical protein
MSRSHPPQSAVQKASHNHKGSEIASLEEIRRVTWHEISSIAGRAVRRETESAQIVENGIDGPPPTLSAELISL